MKKVFVTGASGFIGYHALAPLLARGYEVHAVQSRNAPVTHPDVVWHATDLFDRVQTKRLFDTLRPSHLLHLAWYVVPGKVIDALESLAWVQTSLQLMTGFQESGGKRLVISGSCYEYDWRYGYCNEALTPCTPNTFYGVCKNSLQSLMADFSRITGLSSAWGRVFFLYGPREHPQRLVSSVIRSLLQNQPALCSHGEQIRDYMAVHDVADALAALLDSEIEGPCNIGNGIPTPLKSIVTRIGELMGKPELIKLGALPARANDAPLVLADPVLLTTRLSWKPHYGLDDGLRTTIDWWRRQLQPQGNV